MKNYKKVYAALILAGGLILHGCNGIFDDLAINPNQPSMGAYFTSPSAVNDAVMTMYGYMSTQRCLGELPVPKQRLSVLMKHHPTRIMGNRVCSGQTSMPVTTLSNSLIH